MSGDARQAAIELGAQAYYEWATMNEGETSRWDEAGPHQAFARARAEVVLDALLAPHRVTCPTCRGTNPLACSNARCEDGTVPAEPLAVLSADVAELAAWHAECDKVGVPYDPPGLVRHHRNNAEFASAMNAETAAIWKARAEAAEAEVERLSADLPKYERVSWNTVMDAVNYDEPHGAHCEKPSPFFVRVPAPSEEDK